MDEAVIINDKPPVEVDKKIPIRYSTIRSQLIWASLFPLALFGLLSTLVMSSALHQIIINLAIQRNSAFVQTAAVRLNSIYADKHRLADDDLLATLASLQPEQDSSLYLVDTKGGYIAGSADYATATSFNSEALSRLIQNWKTGSALVQSTISEDTLIASFIPLKAGEVGAILVEPVAMFMAPALTYQIVLAALLVLGTVLSLYMLSLSIGRVVRPIAELAESASQAAPGSVFHPMPEHGPLELRALIKAFNQMVIRLAEQQNVLRQYAHKALLSQEEERQRISHELHDETVQELVGFGQRLELCRYEIERDPVVARSRLDELKNLVEQSIDNVRRISNGLRPSILEDLGLTVAVQSLCNDLRQQMPGVSCACDISGEPRRLPPDFELAVYRVVQEALVNIRKHAPNTSRVAVELAYRKQEISVSVGNDGSAIPDADVRSLVHSGHLGLAGMYERARLFGGELNVSSEPVTGTVITLRLPYP